MLYPKPAANFLFPPMAAVTQNTTYSRNSEWYNCLLWSTWNITGRWPVYTSVRLEPGPQVQSDTKLQLIHKAMASPSICHERTKCTPELCKQRMRKMVLLWQSQVSDVGRPKPFPLPLPPLSVLWKLISTPLWGLLLDHKKGWKKESHELSVKNPD